MQYFTLLFVLYFIEGASFSELSISHYKHCFGQAPIRLYSSEMVDGKKTETFSGFVLSRPRSSGASYLVPYNY